MRYTVFTVQKKLNNELNIQLVNHLTNQRVPMDTYDSEYEASAGQILGLITGSVKLVLGGGFVGVGAMMMAMPCFGITINSTINSNQSGTTRNITSIQPMVSSECSFQGTTEFSATHSMAEKDWKKNILDLMNWNEISIDEMSTGDGACHVACSIGSKSLSTTASPTTSFQDEDGVTKYRSTLRGEIQDTSCGGDFSYKDQVEKITSLGDIEIQSVHHAKSLDLIATGFREIFYGTHQLISCCPYTMFHCMKAAQKNTARIEPIEESSFDQVIQR